MEVTTQEIELGKLYAERYFVQKLLGEGGMGRVFRVQDTLLGDEIVALKVMLHKLSRDEQKVKRFLREVQLTRKVTDPLVVRTFDVGVWNDQLYLTMEYIEGVTLKEQLQENSIDAAGTSRVLHAIASGLHAIHAAGVIHRDLKPSNVILMSEGVLKIADFGIAKPSDEHQTDLTKHNEIVGSSPYIAPETWLGKDVSPLTDIYALGVIGYEMITGILPFDAESPAEFMFKHLETSAVPPHEINPDTPLWMSKLIMRMLAKDPEKRPYTCAAVIAEIERGLAGIGDDDFSECLLRPEISDNETNLEASSVFLRDDVDAEADSNPGLTSNLKSQEPLIFQLEGSASIERVGTHVIPEEEDARTCKLPSIRSCFSPFFEAGIVLVIAAVAIWLIQFTGQLGLKLLWAVIGGHATSAGMFCMLIVVVGSLILSIPIIALGYLIGPQVGIHRDWVRVWFRVSCLGMALHFVQLARLLLNQVLKLSYPGPEHFDKVSVDAVGAAIRNLTEAASLVLNGTGYALLYGETTHFLRPLQFGVGLPHLIFLMAFLGYALVACSILGRALPGKGKEWKVRSVAMFFGILLLGAGEGLLQKYADPVSMNFVPASVLKFGPISFEFSSQTLTWALCNWIGLILLVAFARSVSQFIRRHAAIKTERAIAVPKENVRI